LLAILTVIFVGLAGVAYVICRFILTNLRERRAHDLSVLQAQILADRTKNNVVFK
jgi:hypothetical protein